MSLRGVWRLVSYTDHNEAMAARGWHAAQVPVPPVPHRCRDVVVYGWAAARERLARWVCPWLEPPA